MLGMENGKRNRDSVMGPSRLTHGRSYGTKTERGSRLTKREANNKSQEC